jgi:hypothetical protein
MEDVDGSMLDSQNFESLESTEGFVQVAELRVQLDFQ